MDTSKSAILFVEDCDEDFEYVSDAIRSLTTISNPITRVKSAKQAIASLYNHPPYSANYFKLPIGLIVLDLNIPGIGGTTFLRSLRAHEAYATTPVIVYSGMASSLVISKCIEFGATDYVSKMENIRVLLDVIREHLPAMAYEPPKWLANH